MTQALVWPLPECLMTSDTSVNITRPRSVWKAPSLVCLNEIQTPYTRTLRKNKIQSRESISFQTNVKCSGPVSKYYNEHRGIGLQRPALCGSAWLYSVSLSHGLSVRVHYSRQHLQDEPRDTSQLSTRRAPFRVPGQQWGSACLSLLIQRFPWHI